MSYSLLWFIKINTELLRGVFTTQRFDTENPSSVFIRGDLKYNAAYIRKRNEGKKGKRKKRRGREKEGKGETGGGKEEAKGEGENSSYTLFHNAFKNTKSARKLLVHEMC